MNSDALNKKIEITRIKMIAVGMSEGFTSKNTIRLSETLDKLIYKKLNS